jgi:Resolvase, N terminal domain
MVDPENFEIAEWIRAWRTFFKFRTVRNHHSKLCTRFSRSGKVTFAIVRPSSVRYPSMVVRDAFALQSLAEQVDTSTPTGKMIFTVLGAVSELERNLR